MRKVVTLEAKGVMRVSPLGIYVDDTDILKELSEKLQTKTDYFAGQVQIKIVDETEPVKITDGTEQTEPWDIENDAD